MPPRRPVNGVARVEMVFGRFPLVVHEYLFALGNVTQGDELHPSFGLDALSGRIGIGRVVAEAAQTEREAVPSGSSPHAKR